MSESETTKTFRNGKVKHKDGNGLEYEASYEDGDFSFASDKAARTVVYDRGVIVGVRKGNDPVLTASYTVDMREFANSGAATIVDVLEGTNAWADAVSTGGANFEFPVHTVEFTVEGIANQDPADHVLTCSKVLGTWDFKEGDRNKLTIKLEIYGGFTRTGA